MSVDVMKYNLMVLGYHGGTMAFGSFLIAMLGMIKLVFEMFANQYESMAGSENAIVKVFTCCFRCCIWCLDSCVKFVSENAFV